MNGHVPSGQLIVQVRGGAAQDDFKTRGCAQVGDGGFVGFGSHAGCGGRLIGV